MFGPKKNIASRELEIKIRDQLGVEQQLVGPKEINDLEPNLKKFYHGGVFYPNARHTINPRKVLLKLFDLFIKKGGKFKKTNITYKKSLLEQLKNYFLLKFFLNAIFQ